jgi:hypothetical protein
LVVAVIETAAGDSGGPDASLTPPAAEQEPDDQTGLLVMLGGAIGLAVLYAGLYVNQAAQLGRYREGFVLSMCPVCEEGELLLEERRYRLLGIPRVRRVVRCDTCRSVLRQVGRQRWRYAVDGVANPDLYDEFNGHVLTEDDLLDIASDRLPGRAAPVYRR